MTLKKRLSQLETTKAQSAGVDMIIFDIIWRASEEHGEPTVIGRLGKVPTPSGPWVWVSQWRDETVEDFTARCESVKTGVIDAATFPPVSFDRRHDQRLA